MTDFLILITVLTALCSVAAFALGDLTVSACALTIGIVTFAAAATLIRRHDEVQR
ncbi:hypothetical protein [Mycobacterium marinum]|uniref:hypothetical protein n=1 Tax=Mycobacterium marinum TaxID=1781 RepID=UPI003561F71A